MRFAVIGAGASGIAAAVTLAQAGADVLVAEAGEAAGGALRSHREAGFLFEDGPISVLDSDGDFEWLCAALGIDGGIVSPSVDVKTRYVHHDGELRALPASAAEVATTPLLSFGERLRLMKEPFVAPAPPGAEETVIAFAARRFGDGVARKYANALVSGVFAGDAAKLSLDAAFPEVRALERAHGSLMKAAGAKRPEGGRRGRRGLISLRDGLGGVGEAAASFLGERLRVRTRVDAVTASNHRIVVGLSGPATHERVDVDGVVVATPAHAAARMLAAVAPEAAAALRGVEHTSLAVVQAGFRAEELSVPRGFGFLATRSPAGPEALGWVFASQLFDGRAPAGCVALNGFFGGSLAPAPLALTDPELGELAVRDLAKALGSKRVPAPALLRVVRWNEALPQYHLGHRERIAAARAGVRAIGARVMLAGNYLDGISVPASIASGRAAAAALLDTEREAQA